MSTDLYSLDSDHDDPPVGGSGGSSTSKGCSNVTLVLMVGGVITLLSAISFIGGIIAFFQFFFS